MGRGAREGGSRVLTAGETAQPIPKANTMGQRSEPGKGLPIQPFRPQRILRSRAERDRSAVRGNIPILPSFPTLHTNGWFSPDQQASKQTKSLLMVEACWLEKRGAITLRQDGPVAETAAVAASARRRPLSAWGPAARRALRGRSRAEASARDRLPWNSTRGTSSRTGGSPAELRAPRVPGPAPDGPGGAPPGSPVRRPFRSHRKRPGGAVGSTG